MKSFVNTFIILYLLFVFIISLIIWTTFFRDDVNKAYRRLAVLLHPDKSVAPGSEEAFKLLVAARTTLLKKCS
jgi:hypothetical protein